ncbi:MAG: dTMP kinase [Silvanigrellaceae bacterium]|nr:dTMP kinase [Silvanigrellaceae bacterium]
MVFIVFEGGESVGKSTQIELLFRVLNQAGINCIKTREPGGTPFAESIRALFKQEVRTDAPVPFAELMLVLAARAQHLQNFIYPKLKCNNTLILCDRFMDSTYVYQHFLAGLSKQTIDVISQFILDSFLPDLTFVFSLEAEQAVARMKQNRLLSGDRFDHQELSFHKKVMQSYQFLCESQFAYPCGRVPRRVFIDASLSQEEVFGQIAGYVKHYLGISI